MNIRKETGQGQVIVRHRICTPNFEEEERPLRGEIDKSNVASKTWATVPFGRNETGTLQVISQQGYSEGFWKFGRILDRMRFDYDVNNRFIDVVTIVQRDLL